MKTKKFKLLIILFLLSSVGFSQKNQSWNNTFLYGFQLPDALENYSGIYVVIKYNGEPLISKTIKIRGKLITIDSEPFYLLKKSAFIGNLKLPFEIQGKTYYWLLDSTILNQTALNPKSYQIDIVTTNVEATKQYKLPVTFDFTSEKCLNIAYLLSFAPAKRNKIIQEKIQKLNVLEK